MKTKFLTLLTLILFSFGLSQKAHKVNVIHLQQYKEDKAQSIYFADYDASRRGSIILHDHLNKQNPIKILSEPPPDAIIAFTSAITNSLNVQDKITTSQSLQFSQAISELTKRNTTVVVLRDALYRLNEFNFNNPGLLKKEDYLEKFEKILRLAEKLTEIDKQQLKNEAIDKNQELLKEKKFLGMFTKTPVYFQVTDKSLRDFSDKIIDQLNLQGYNADGTELVELNIKSNMLKYFDEMDKEKAIEIKNDLTNLGVKNLQIIKASNPKNYKDRFEVWLKE